MTTIKIKGMSCQHCVNAVTKALGGIEGVRDVQVSLEKAEATFTAAKPVDRDILRDVLKKAGYEAE